MAKPREKPVLLLLLSFQHELIQPFSQGCQSEFHSVTLNQASAQVNRPAQKHSRLAMAILLSWVTQYLLAEILRLLTAS